MRVLQTWSGRHGRMNKRRREEAKGRILGSSESKRQVEKGE